MEECSCTQLIVSPEYLRLLREVEVLRQEVIGLVLERNDLFYRRAPELEECYIRLVGGLENDLSRVRVEAVRIKYIIDVIKLKLKFDSVVDIAEIERNATQSCEKAGAASLTSDGNEGDTREGGKQEENESEGSDHEDYDHEELRLIYRKIIKALHPDIAGGEPCAGERLLKNAIVAYENRDLQLLKNIEAVLEEIDSSGLTEGKSKDTLSFLGNRIKDLKAKKQEIKESIKEAKKEFPLNQEVFLSDLRKVENVQRRLETAIEAENGKLEKLQDKLRYYKMKCN